MLDDSGQPIEVDLAVSRAEYETIIWPLVAKTVSTAKALMERNRDAQPDAVLMVGGPTQTPLIRQLLSDGLGIRIDTSSNPLSVVAEGAALYAATQLLPSSGPALSSTARSNVVELVFKSLTDTDSQLVGCKAQEPVYTIEFAAVDRSWSSGQVLVSAGSMSTRVPLPSKGLHEFSVIARTSSGELLGVEPSKFGITRGLTALAAPLSKAFGVVVEDGSGEQEVQWLLHKNSPLPALGRYEFKTTIALEPGGEIEIIQIHIVEGDGDSTRPGRQRQVGDLTITDQIVPRTVPVGNPIEVRLAIDESRILSAEAYLPLIDQTFSATVDIRADDVEAKELTDLIETERARLASLAQHVPADTTRGLHQSLRVAEEESSAAIGGDPDTAQRALRMIQSIQLQVDALEDAQRLPMTIAEAREESEITNGVVMDYGNDGHRARVAALIRDLDEAVATGSVSEIRRAEAKLTRLKWELLANQFDWWVGYFAYMSQNVTGWTDVARADQLMREGHAQVIREDLAGLREVCLELRPLVRLQDEKQLGKFQNVGIRR
jgi:molecular chaperone DnaK